MGSATDGPSQLDLLGTTLVQPGMWGTISGSPTDGMRIMGPSYYPQQQPMPFQTYTQPAAAPPPAAAAPPPPPPPGPPEPPPPGPPPPPPVTPIDPGGPIDQPSSLGNSLGGALLNPPNFFIGGTDAYKKKGMGSLQTTQT